jgi:hypothetical protein
VPEEVAPPDARQQVLGATGWYDRVSWLAMLLPLVQDGILHARFKTSQCVEMAFFGERSFPHGSFERQ